MSLPVVATVLRCVRCDSHTNLRLIPTPTVNVQCAACGEVFTHPDQSLAADVVRGRERIDLDRST